MSHTDYLTDDCLSVLALAAESLAGKGQTRLAKRVDIVAARLVALCDAGNAAPDAPERLRAALKAMVLPVHE